MRLAPGVAGKSPGERTGLSPEEFAGAALDCVDFKAAPRGRKSGKNVIQSKLAIARSQRERELSSTCCGGFSNVGRRFASTRIHHPFAARACQDRFRRNAANGRLDL